MLLKISFSSVMITSFSTSDIFVELELKYGVTFFQNSLLSATSFTLNLSKYCFFVFLKRFRQKFRSCLYFCQLKWVLSLLKMFLSFDRSTIAFLNSFVIKRLLSCRKIFFFKWCMSI